MEAREKLLEALREHITADGAMHEEVIRRAVSPVPFTAADAQRWEKIKARADAASRAVDEAFKGFQ
jgi:hypothetical protein